ncbi:MAG: hypothetical protein AAF289_03300 [Cyanobacteria bacterium P01_A01_bin.135]
MGAKLFGVPLVVWGGVCLILTVIWISVWPSEKVTAADGLRFIILRWFHALAWLLLAAAAFVSASRSIWAASAANVLALLALFSYLVFIVAFITV